jgi:DNA-binding GntR family transcriptional regulator
MQQVVTGSTSQTSRVYRLVRQHILSGRFAPGEKLKINELASSLEVSPGAIREALSRLVPEQLVVSQEQRGFVVAPLSIADLEDLTDLRCEIEAIALRRSVRRGGLEWEASLLAASHRLQNTRQLAADPVPALVPEWVDHHAAFHAALVSACGSRRLLTLHASLYEQAERYRGLSVYVESGRDVGAEHSALLEAALSHNADRLIDLTIQHMRRTTELIIASARTSASSGAGRAMARLA